MCLNSFLIAAPPIDADKISVIRSDTTVTVSWPSLGRLYTKIEIEFCVIRGSNRGTCTIHKVTDTSVTKTTLIVEEGKEYAYTMRIYDMDDIVFTSPTLASRTECMFSCEKLLYCELITFACPLFSWILHFDHLYYKKPRACVRHATTGAIFRPCVILMLRWVLPSPCWSLH
jgi:hypothetical protein